MDCIFLHGWGVTNKVWREFATKLSGFDNILTPCLYAIARKSKDKGFKSIAETLSKTIKKNSILIAWSIGGLVALRLLRATTKIRAVVFIASTPCFVNQKNWQNVIKRNDLIQLKKRFANDMWGTLNYFAGLIAYGDINSSQTNKYIRQHLVEEKQNEILSFWLTALEENDQRNQFAELEIPSRIILGQNDVLIKPQIKDQVEVLNPSIHCEIIKNCGHAPFVSRTKETHNLIYKFLNERL